MLNGDRMRAPHNGRDVGSGTDARALSTVRMMRGRAFWRRSCIPSAPQVHHKQLASKQARLSAKTNGVRMDVIGHRRHGFCDETHERAAARLFLKALCPPPPSAASLALFLRHSPTARCYSAPSHSFHIHALFVAPVACAPFALLQPRNTTFTHSLTRPLACRPLPCLPATSAASTHIP